MRPAWIQGPSRIVGAVFLPRVSIPIRTMASGGGVSGGTVPPPQLLSVAPMMDWTDVHYRQLARLISKHTWLYTEMVVDSTVIHTDHKDRYLWFPEEQHPIVCQLGGSNPKQLADAARTVATYGYDEINLNCGCPSDRVAGAGCFGAALMLQPDIVASACSAVSDAISGTPITVKCRLGVDDVDSYADMCRFIDVVSRNSPVTHFVIHARKCLLKGLSPAQNRTIPPLRYEWVWALKRDFPHLDFSLNGGIQSCHEAAEAIACDVEGSRIHGVMVGRAAYNAPWACLADADRAVFGAQTNAATSRRQVLEEYSRYADSMIGRFGRRDDGHCIPSARVLIKPLLGMFHGERGGKRFRNVIDTVLLKMPKDVPVSEVLELALRAIPDEVLDAPPRALQQQQRRHTGSAGAADEVMAAAAPAAEAVAAAAGSAAAAAQPAAAEAVVCTSSPTSFRDRLAPLPSPVPLARGAAAATDDSGSTPQVMRAAGEVAAGSSGGGQAQDTRETVAAA